MSKRRTVSITDIARETGVSIAAVSRILNYDENIKVRDETRDKVLQTARQLGYQPNLFAAALRTKRTGVIGALSPNLAGTFLGLLAAALGRAAKTRGVDLLIGLPEVGSDKIEVQLQKLQRLLFDGLLLLGNVLDYQETIRELRVIRKPYLSVCAGMNVAAPLINVDDEYGTRIALEYLVSLGHIRIAFLCSPNWPQERYRVGYFQTAMQELDLPVRPEYLAVMTDVPYIPQAENFMQMWTTEPLQAMQSLLRLPEPPTAVFCANDGFALAGMKGALQLGLRVPQDVSILGYNDELTSTLFYPELTTIRQPLDKIARVAIETLLRAIDSADDNLPEPRILITPELIIRQTCAAPAHRFAS